MVQVYIRSNDGVGWILMLSTTHWCFNKLHNYNIIRLSHRLGNSSSSTNVTSGIPSYSTNWQKTIRLSFLTWSLWIHTHFTTVPLLSIITHPHYTKQNFVIKIFGSRKFCMLSAFLKLKCLILLSYITFWHKINSIHSINTYLGMFTALALQYANLVTSGLKLCAYSY